MKSIWYNKEVIHVSYHSPMTGIKELIEVNTKGALLGVQEGGFSFLNQFNALPKWKRIVILTIAITLVPGYLIARFGTEQFLARQYGQQALSAHAAFNIAQDPVVGEMQIIRNPNATYSGVVLITNPNVDLSATGMTYVATFQNSSKQTVYTANGSLYMLPNEKKYIVIPRISATADATVTSGSIKIDNINWQKRLNVPEVSIKAAEPILSDMSNPLTFVAEGSIINESPYQIGAARIVFLLFDDQNKIIGVSQRDESRLLPYGRRAYKQLWPGLYRSQVRKVQVIPSTNVLDPQNISTTTTTTPAPNNSADENPF